MNILEQIKEHKEELTPRELKIYNLVMENPIDISSSTTPQIAARYHVSQSSISRFCQKVGYSSFSDFRMALYLSSLTNTYTNAAPPKDLTFYMGEQINAIRAALPAEQLDTLAARLLQANAVYLTGTTYSSIPAQLLTQQLVLASVPAHFVQPGSESELLHITKDADVFVLFSAGNPTHADFLRAVQEISPAKRPYTVLVTMTAKHPLRKQVSQVICLPSWTALHYPIAVDASFATNVFCNIFSNHLMSYISAHGAAEQAGDS